MSDWLLAGLGITLFIAGFNVGQECKFQRGFFGRKKKYKYYVSCIYKVYGVISYTGKIGIFNEEMTEKLLDEFIEELRKFLKNKFRTEDVAVTVVDFKRLKD